MQIQEFLKEFFRLWYMGIVELCTYGKEEACKLGVLLF